MEKIVGELFEIVKALVAAHKARGEALDKSIGERLAKAEQGLYDARKAAHEAAQLAQVDRLEAPSDK